MGKRNAPAHRIVVTDKRSPRDGRFIEVLGFYDPRGREESVDLERADYWLSQGAQPSDTVAAIIKRAKAGVPLGNRPKDKEREAQEAARIVAEAKAAVERKEAAEKKKAAEDAAAKAAAKAEAAAKTEAATADSAEASE